MGLTCRNGLCRLQKTLPGNTARRFTYWRRCSPLAEVYTRHGMGPDAASPSEYAKEAVRNAVKVQIEGAYSYLNDLAKVCEAEGIPVRTAVREASALRLIRDYAADNDIDLVVMSSHGRGGIHRMLIGSVADRVIRTLGVPVLVIPGESSQVTS